MRTVGLTSGIWVWIRLMAIEPVLVGCARPDARDVSGPQPVPSRGQLMEGGGELDFDVRRGRRPHAKTHAIRLGIRAKAQLPGFSAGVGHAAGHERRKRCASM